MKDLRNVFVLFIVAFVAVIAVVVMLVSPSVNLHFSNSVGFAANPLYSGYAVPINGIIVDNNLNFASSSDTIQKSVDVSDDIVYRRAYVSYDGSSWTQFNLTPVNTVSGDWIYIRGITNISFSPSMLHLNTSRTSSNNTFIIVYSCSKNNTIHNWSCHDGWQIIPLNARMNSVNSGSKVVIYAAGRAGDDSIYPIMELWINNVMVASWNVTGDVFVPTYDVYNYTYSSIIDNRTLVRVNYPNDVYGTTRDLRVDKIVIDGKAYESESASNINTGMWDGTNCGSVPYPGNEWLNCTGYIQYNLSSESTPVSCTSQSCGGGGTPNVSGSSTPSPSNTDLSNLGICLSSGYNCGTKNISGVNRNCGICPTGLTCNANNLCVGTSGHNTYYIATSANGGNDNNPGTFSNPWASWQKGFSTATAGDIVYIRGGTYNSGFFGVYSGNYYGVRVSNHDGTASNPITILAYPGEKPVLDGSSFINQGYPGAGIDMEYCDHWYIKGLTVANALEYYNGNSYPYRRDAWTIGDCTYITFDQCTVRDSGGGFTLGGSDDYINYTNCDAIHCASHEDQGDYANGFTGNIRVGNHVSYTGCRAFRNSDDGFDNMAGDGYIIYNNCWAFNNGGLSDFPAGNGDGFKLGSPENNNNEGGEQRICNNCLAFGNSLGGFDESVVNGPYLNMALYNCVAYNNGASGFGFYNANIGPGIITIKNCISYYDVRLTDNSEVELRSNVVHNHNSWDTSGITVSDADFQNLNSTGADGPRNADGSLPNLSFLHLKSTSGLIDKGVNVGLPYNGNAPDLGAYETG